MRMWRNWQTRTVQVRVSNIVKVRILSSAPIWGVSAAGSASDWQSGGHEFEPRTLHQKCLTHEFVGKKICFGVRFFIFRIRKTAPEISQNAVFCFFHFFYCLVRAHPYRPIHLDQFILERFYEHIEWRVEFCLDFHRRSFFTGDVYLFEDRLVQQPFDRIVGVPVTHPIQTAKTTIANILAAVKRMFPIRVGNLISKIRLPHFSISGGFSLNPPRVPHFSVAWYKTGGIFNKPTLMPGIGEAGPEAVVPLDQFWAKLDSMAESLRISSENNAALMALLAQYLPYLPELANMQLVTDTGALVGQLAPQMDDRLGILALRQRRQ